MSKAKLILTGTVCYLVFMLCLTPASWWLKLVTLPKQLELGAASGTLWQGSIAGAQYQKLQFGQINWTLNGWAIFRGKVEFELKSGSAKQPQLPFLQSDASYGFGGARLDNTLIKMPIAQVLPLLDLPLPVDASGQLVLDVAQFSEGQPWCGNLAGQASWQDARLQTPTGTWLELNSLFGRLSCNQGTVVLTTDSNNVLGLDVTAVLNAEQLLVNGTVKPDDGMPKEVHQAMQFLGRPDAQGRYTLKF